MRPVLVLGIGNLLMRDDAVGVIVAQRLTGLPAVAAVADVIDGGTMGVGLIHLLEGRTKVIIIDCAYMGKSPGYMHRMELKDLVSAKHASILSGHQVDLIAILRMAAVIGSLPREVVLFGIEPKKVAPGMGLSDELEAKLDYYVSSVAHEVDSLFCNVR